MSVLPSFHINDFEVKNEPILTYLKGSKELAELESAVKNLLNKTTDIPIVIGDREITNSNIQHQVVPFDHGKKLATFYYASEDDIKSAIESGMSVRPEWERRPISEKIKVFLKAGDLLATKYRAQICAATILGQGKTIFQAEIDAACESVDFLRFNALFAKDLLKYKPISEKPDEVLNSMRFRGLEGFVAAISPFNFTAIGTNLASSPTIWGNVVLWKPSETAMLSNWIAFQALREAGIPPGVINFVPSLGPTFGNAITSSQHLAGINFTGSVPTFRLLWQLVAQNLSLYRNIPRLIGECGGKNFHLVHGSADVKNAALQTARSAFEYSGQKCSACSRAYIAQSIWPQFKEELLLAVGGMKVGSPLDYSSFFSCVIDKRAFDRIKSYIEYAQNSPNLTLLHGGQCDDNLGYFIQPTVVQTTDPSDKLMREEIFGPVLTVYVFDDSRLSETIDLVNETTPYALTGAIFGADITFLTSATEKLKMAAGNFYVNDKSTGAVVGQQPFGGSRLSGTNDKAGAPYYMLRWANPQSVKESFTTLSDWKYPYMTN